MIKLIKIKSMGRLILIAILLFSNFAYGAVYNDSAISNATNPLELAKAESQAISGGGNEFLLGWLILITLFLILFSVSLRTEDIRPALVLNSMVCAIVALLLVGAGLVSMTAVAAFSILFIISIIILFIGG